MGVVNFGIPRELALRCRSQLGVEQFVETGTYRGETARWAKDHFKRVYTVEYDRDRHAAAAALFAAHPSVKCLPGHSPQALHQILGELAGAPALYWLDAHWCGDAASHEANDPCPVAAELAVLNAADAEAYILVDDARLFLAPPEAPHNPDHWPGLAELVPLLSNGGKRYVIAVDDVLIAFPMKAKPMLIEWSRSRPPAWAPASATAGRTAQTPGKGPVFFISKTAGGR